ncbi:G patch domain-containing protein 11 [Boothiomyces sp. JEL0838]|nr:G patch domain-containing protein 11 [Boothiomyces sp. JEL0838]
MKRDHSDDEDDYMNFVVEEQPTEVSYQQKRIKQLNQQQQKGYNKPKELQRREDLDVALSTEISSENKGFQMLQKMGYKKGQGLGNTKDAITEPIQITLSSAKDKSGIGNREYKFETVKEKNLKEAKFKYGTKTFLNDRQKLYKEKMYEADLKKLRLSCMTMDEQNAITSNEFWPTDLQKKPVRTLGQYNTEIVEEDEEKDEESFESKPVGEKVEIVNTYLREKYFYCLWCGCVYKDEADLERNCPGDERDDHDE